MEMEFGTFIGIIIVSLICGAISKSISDKRGIAGGFWWGFFLLVIGIIVVALMPVDKARQEEYLNNTAHIYYCPQCGKTFSGVSDKKNDNCPNCNRLLLETSILRDDWQNYSDDKKEQLKRAFAEGQYSRNAPSTNAPVSIVGGADEIKKYKELLDNGIITKEEFEAKKKQLLGL